MFSNQGYDQGCGKWLSTKKTRRRALLLKQENARRVKKGRKKKAAFKNDHVPGVAISSTPMSPRLIEMLSRVKQAKVERFFKPVDPKGRNERISESKEVSSDKQKMLQSNTLRRQQKVILDQENLPECYNDPSSEGHQNYTGKLNISGILPIEISQSGSSAESLTQILQLPITPESKIEPSQDETRSPVSKRLRSMIVKSPTNPPSSSPSISNDEKDSDSFHFTQWVNEQKRKSKEIQSNKPVTIPESRQTGTKILGSSGESPTSGSTNLNWKDCQGIHDETFTDTESQFHFKEWALEQKLKCKRLQEAESCPTDEAENVDNTLKEARIPLSPQSEFNWTDSDFQYTEWVRKPKSHLKQIQQSLQRSKKVSPTHNELVIDSSKESNDWISELDIYERIEFGRTHGWQHAEKNDDMAEIKSQTIINSKAEVLRNISNVNLCTKQAFKDVSNGSTFKSKSELAGPFQKSEPFQYTDWTNTQRQIYKTNQKEVKAAPSSQDDFWVIPSEKNVTNSRNESQETERLPILASDTDEESDTEVFAQFS